MSASRDIPRDIETGEIGGVTIATRAEHGRDAAECVAWVPGGRRPDPGAA